MTEHDVLARIERARRTPARVRESHITLSHGSGGKAMHDLIEAVFLRAFDNPALAAREDQAVLEPAGASPIAFTTDSFVVAPLFFPGGDIGCLAVHGTLNDLACSGAEPVALSASFILEEGLELATLERVVASMKAAAAEAAVPIVTGDTKVVERGKADGLYINTAGIGVLRRPAPPPPAGPPPGAPRPGGGPGGGPPRPAAPPPPRGRAVEGGRRLRAGLRQGRAQAHRRPRARLSPAGRAICRQVAPGSRWWSCGGSSVDRWPEAP
jgi:hydrogenase expression/formation protein HypE